MVPLVKYLQKQTQVKFQIQYVYYLLLIMADISLKKEADCLYLVLIQE